MLSKKSSILIASIITLLSFLSVVYVSCTKPGLTPFSCNGVVCENGGYCDSSRCVCPSGFEGINCATVSVSKYVGTWNINQKIIGSDSANCVGMDSAYVVFLVQSATPTTFFINNFSGDPYYNDVICTMDSINSSHFTLDTLSAFHMVFNHYRLLYGNGDIEGDTIKATLAVRHLNRTINWQNDTLSLKMVRQ